MAGLVAAARLRELGVASIVLEKGTRPGGSMVLSSGVIWRHRTLDDFQAECRDGDPELQGLIVEQLDDRLDWLESLGASVTQPSTGNPRTVGRRFDPTQLLETLFGRAGAVRLDERLGDLDDEQVLLATGGFGATLARQLSLPLRAGPWSEGDGLLLARAQEAATSPGMDEFYGRALPAPPARIPTDGFVPLAQVYGRHALVLDEEGSTIPSADRAWHENDLVQDIARRPGGTAWYVVGDDALGLPVSHGTVEERIGAARAAGGTVLAPDGLPFPVPNGYRYAVHVIATVTHTIGGLVVDCEARVLRDDGVPVDGLYAAGVDVGGIATGGYSSGLAAALVLGCVAAESLAR
jgi:fumarate reductase flavoprotein subunit